MLEKSKLSKKSNYDNLIKNISSLLESARKNTARVVNTILTATYWEIGRRIVVYEQSGSGKAEYGKQLLQNLSEDLRKTFGKGFSVDNLESMRLFYLTYSKEKISETVSRKFKSNKSETPSQFYERTLLSKNKTVMLRKGSKDKSEDIITPEEQIKDPFILEFLGLKDEYSENDLEEALVLHLEKFLLELGGDFTFIGRQKRLRIGNEWYRIDLLFFHRKLRCLIVIDLKVGKFSHADAGQMHLYLNYAKEHWTNKDENPPVGIILCAEKDNAVAKYALEGLPNKVLASEYKLVLPDEKLLAREIEQTRKILENRKKIRKK